jgi:carbon-monoxide dehydrogenase large subunit
VRYVGEPVAAVAVDDRYHIEDALDMITVDYDPLPAVTSIEDALKDGAPHVNDELGTNQAY